MKRAARPDSPRASSSSGDEALSVESAVATLRAAWNAVEEVSGPDQVSLKAEIIDAISRLKSLIDGRLRSREAGISIQPRLFDDASDRASAPRFPEPVLRVYAKDFADHAIKHLPQAVKCHSVEELRNYLTERLRFNSEATRRRSANYIVSRFFPGEVYNNDLPQFAATTEGTPALGEALFYLTCRTEKIVALVADEVVFPSLAQGGVSRSRLREYIQSKFPHSKSADDIGQAIIRSYQFYGLGSANRTRLNVSLREGSLASFAYVLHLEFPEPGMHAFEIMFEGPMHKWLLWDQHWMVQQLYRLREAGLLSKVSEIDRLRQFTTKYTLSEAVPRIVALAQEYPR